MQVCLKLPLDCGYKLLVRLAVICRFCNIGDSGEEWNSKLFSLMYNSKLSKNHTLDGAVVAQSCDEKGSSSAQACNSIREKNIILRLAEKLH